MASISTPVEARGARPAAVSNALVGLLHRYTGRGPTRARTTIDDNLVVCVLGATLTKGEQSLVLANREDVVLHSRRAFQDTMRADAIEAVQSICGRKVLAFMSTNHIDPDLAVEIFVLAPESHDNPDIAPELASGHNGLVAPSGE